MGDGAAIEGEQEHRPEMAEHPMQSMWEGTRDLPQAIRDFPVTPWNQPVPQQMLVDEVQQMTHDQMEQIRRLADELPRQPLTARDENIQEMVRAENVEEQRSRMIRDMMNTGAQPVEVRPVESEVRQVIPEGQTPRADIRHLLPASVIELVKSAPHNDSVRMLVLAHLKLEIPKELTYWPEIQEWIEKNVPPPKPHDSVRPNPTGRMVVHIPIAADEVEYGTCRFRRSLHGEALVPINLNRLIEMAREAESIDDLMRELNDEVSNVWRDHVEMNPSGEPSLDHEEVEGHDDTDWNYNTPSDIGEYIMGILQQHAPDQAERLEE